MLHYRAVVKRTTWYYHKNGEVDQCNRIEDPDVNSLTCGQFIFYKDARNINLKKNTVEITAFLHIFYQKLKV